MYKEKIIDIETGEEIYRNYTADEIAIVKEAEIKADALAAEQAKKEIARKSLLERLGITEDEAKLLLS